MITKNIKKKFSEHLDLSHSYWKNLLKKGDHVIDATCGNGNDSIFLARQVLGKNIGSLSLFDIQIKAILKTKKKLSQNLSLEDFNRISFHHQSNENLFSSKNPLVSLIVYNLGYLPGGEKTITTTKKTTLISIKNALPLLREKGAISLMCYPGHKDGKEEEEAILDFSSTLDSSIWSVCYHKWLNRLDSPSLIWIKKR
jgi:SAM-dependent methyltransferase